MPYVREGGRGGKAAADPVRDSKPEVIESVFRLMLVLDDEHAYHFLDLQVPFQEGQACPYLQSSI